MGGVNAHIVMVERYWFGIHKVAGTAESASNGATNESAATVTESIVYDFSKLDSSDTYNQIGDQLGDQLHVRIHGSSDQSAQNPGSDVPYSAIGLDLHAAQTSIPPSAKDGSGPAQAGSAPR